MESIDFQPRTRLVYAPRAIERLGEITQEQGVSRVLVVSDSGVVAAGHFQRAVDALQRSDIQVSVFLGVRENPSTDDVAAGVEVARQSRPELLIGLGGGSSMDCAKGINFIYSCGGEMQDYWGVGKATADMLPMIAIPTTAGTGSEAQSFALITHAQTKAKMACGDARAACRVAILDPELTVTQPPRVTALTGIDALSHALETYVTTRRNPLGLCYSREAWELLSHGFPHVLHDPHNVEARGQMQLGAYFAGLAIETSMLGAAHALANPLTARYGIVHGQAVGVMLPAVIRFNGLQGEVAEWYEELWRDVAGTELGKQCVGDNSSSLLADFVRRMVRMTGLETQLQQLGVEQSSFEQLAEGATKQWTGTFNPRVLTAADYRDCYQQSFA